MAERKPVPKGIVIPSRTENVRDAIVAGLNKEQPDWIHTFLSTEHAHDPDYLARYGMELVRRSDGEPMRSGADYVAMKPKYVFEAEKAAGEEESKGQLEEAIRLHGETEDQAVAREMRRPITMKEKPKTEADKITVSKSVSKSK
jgi:hypothetical protein